LTRAAGGKVSLDPNLRLELMPLEESRKTWTPFIEAADLLLPTESGAKLLTG
jgi:sugar/nucleoside kinase (ribokinase family)